MLIIVYSQSMIYIYLPDESLGLNAPLFLITLHYLFCPLPQDFFFVLSCFFERVFVLFFVCCFFSLDMIKYTDKSNIEENWFILAHSSRLPSITAGGQGDQKVKQLIIGNDATHSGFSSLSGCNQDSPHTGMLNTNLKQVMPA